MVLISNLMMIGFDRCSSFSLALSLTSSQLLGTEYRRNIQINIFTKIPSFLGVIFELGNNITLQFIHYKVSDK